MRYAIALLLLAAVACSGPTPQATTVPATPTAPLVQPTEAQATASEPGGGGGLPGGTATLTVGDRTYEMSTEGVCQTIVGIQASLATEDRQASMSVFMTGSTGQFLLLDLANNEQWMMPDNPPAWTITGNDATWRGTLHETESDRDAPAEIQIRCGG